MGSWALECWKYHTSEMVIITLLGTLKHQVMGESVLWHTWQGSAVAHLPALAAAWSSPLCWVPFQSLILLFGWATATGRKVRAPVHKVCTVWMVSVLPSGKGQKGFWAPSSKPASQIGLIYLKSFLMMSIQIWQKENFWGSRARKSLICFLAWQWKSTTVGTEDLLIIVD